MTVIIHSQLIHDFTAPFSIGLNLAIYWVQTLFSDSQHEIKVELILHIIFNVSKH